MKCFRGYDTELKEMIRMRSILTVFIISLLPLLLWGGCAPPAPTDEPIKAALEAVLQTDEFAQEERDAVQSITVHGAEAKVWFKTGFTNDGDKINALAEHVGMVFANTFYDTAMEKDFKQPKYNIELWMKVSGEKGSHNALVAEYWYNLQRSKAEGKKYGLGAVKEIR